MSFRPAAVLALAGALLLPATAAAQLQPGQGVTAPSYPGNTLRIERPEPLVAGTVQRVKLAGHATWGEPTSATTTSYSLYLYVANPAIDPTCAPAYGQQLQRSINLPGLNASLAPTGFVISGDQRVSPTPPEIGSDWSGDSLPFAVKPGLTSVLLCAYQRYVTDDVAAFALRVPVVAPSCKLGARTVKRGRALALDCNLSGGVSVRFSGAGRTRTVKAQLDTENGDARVSTRTLRRGRYRVTITATPGDVRLASTTVRIR